MSGGGPWVAIMQGLSHKGPGPGGSPWPAKKKKPRQVIASFSLFYKLLSVLLLISSMHIWIELGLPEVGWG